MSRPLLVLVMILGFLVGAEGVRAGLVFSESPKAATGVDSPADWEEVEADGGDSGLQSFGRAEVSEVEVEAPVTERREVPRFVGRSDEPAPMLSPSFRKRSRTRATSGHPRRARIYSQRSQREESMDEEIITPQGKPGKKTQPAAVEDRMEDGRSMGTSAAFPFTHSLPSPLNIPGGSWQVGTSVAVGVTDFFQVSSNLVRDANRFWNISAKFPLIEFPTFIASAFVNWDTQNLNNFDSVNNPDLRVTSWQPGLVTGYEIADDMALFLGGNFFITKTRIPEDIKTSGFSQGARMNLEWSYLYNPSGSRLADNALSAGMSYDFTYGLFGFGLTHHWPSFVLGLNYTLNADNQRALPTFAFSTGFTF